MNKILKFLASGRSSLDLKNTRTKTQFQQKINKLFYIFNY